MLKCKTSESIVNFINVDAVKTRGTKPKYYTLDQILVECEKDEMQQNIRANTDEIDKQFITWDEFLSYLIDYKEIAERNKR